MDLLQLFVSCLMSVTVCYGDFFRDLEKLDIDSQLEEIDKMFNKIDVNEEEALEALMDKGKGNDAGKAGDILANMFNTDCKFSCPDGSTPKARKSHKPTFNGCGTFGLTFELEDLPEMTSCCNDHDLCYDTCGTVRDDCDDEFKTCLDKMCKLLKKGLSKKEYQGCKDMAKLMYTGTLALGCSPYLEGQREACVCDSENKMADKKSDKKSDEETGSQKSIKTDDKHDKAERSLPGTSSRDTSSNKLKKSKVTKKDEL